MSADVSAEQNIGRGRRVVQIRLAVASRNRLPVVAAVLAAGGIDHRLVITIVNRRPR